MSVISPSVVAGISGLCISAVCAPSVLALLRHRQILDVPSARSSHTEATPRGGGICCLLGAIAALAVASPLALGSRLLLAIAATGFAALGFLDDVHHLPVRIRLLLQTVMAGATAAWLFHASTDATPFAVVFGLATAVWIVAYVNVFNFMDGINGLAAAAAAVSGVTFAIIGCARNDLTLGVGGAIAAGAAVGFVPWNFPRARFFLGDVGSYLFGVWLAVLAVVAIVQHVPFEAVLAPQAVFLADAGSTLAGRVWRGEDWTAAHRSHVYQRLNQLGWSHSLVTSLLTVLMVVIAALGALSLIGSTILRSIADSAAVALLVGYLASPLLVHTLFGLETCSDEEHDGKSVRSSGNARSSRSTRSRREWSQP